MDENLRRARRKLQKNSSSSSNHINSKEIFSSIKYFWHFYVNDWKTVCEHPPSFKHRRQTNKYIVLKKYVNLFGFCLSNEYVNLI